MTTDKTNGLSFETKDNYKLAATPHLRNDEIVSGKARESLENNFIVIGKRTLSFLKVGTARKHDDRLIEAVVTHNTLVPIMKLT